MEETDENEVADRTKSIYLECMTDITRRVFFGTQNSRFSFETSLKKISILKNRKVRYPASRFFRVMVGNGSTGSLCSVAQLEAYRKFTDNRAPVQKLNNQYIISAHGGSKCIGIRTFKFPCGDSAIKFGALIVEKSGSPLILGLSDIDKLQSRGTNQLDNTISF